jgi:leucyl-tRNA synthetase
VDLYVGGAEHAVGHLLYSRMWTKALCDLGMIGFDEPFKKLLNQGMILGNSRFVYRFDFTVQSAINIEPVPIFLSKKYQNEFLKAENKGNWIEGLKLIVALSNQFKDYKVEDEIFLSWSFSEDGFNVDTSLVDGVELNIDAFIKWRPYYNKKAEYILENGKSISGLDVENIRKSISEIGKYICGAEVEKMSKSKYNVVNPDDMVAQYGADTFRMYEMFLGPLEMSKPWDTKGIEGVHRFIKKLWRLYADEQTGWIVTEEAATDAELKVLHKTIKKIMEDMERFSFNTSVSQFMITVNELTSLNCHKRVILEPLAVLICPFAPHLAEELWNKLGNAGSIVTAAFPKFEEKYVTENTKNYPVAINGKPRVEMEFPLDMAQPEIEAAVMANETIQKWLEGKEPKKFIYVKGKMINVVI